MPVLTINGCDHFYEEGGSGDPLVLIHGSIDGSAKTLSGHIPELSEFRVIVPDVRGLGRSAHVSDAPASAWVDDVVSLLDALDEPSAHIYGGAMGSRVALRFALDHPQRVRSLIIDWTILFNEPAADARLGQQYGADVAPARAAALQEHHGDDWVAVTEFYGRLRTTEEFKAYYDLRELSKQVSVPTLVLRGDVDARDDVHPLSHSILAHQNIKDSWLAIFPNTQGSVARTKPDEFRRELRTFISAVSQPKEAARA